MDTQPAAYEPIIVQDAVFYIDRLLDADGELLVHTSDRVDPETEIATAMVVAGRPLTLHIARELGVDPDAVSQYLTRPVGSTFDEGEAIARARRGLRSVTCAAPIASTLTALDPTTGVATLTPTSEPQHVKAAVYGEVESVHERRGALIRASGSRVQGFLGLSGDAFGPLKVAVDRPDRELTADLIDNSFQNAIVIGGMTLGTSALRKLVDVGARGVVVGSVSDSEVRRFLSRSDREPSPMLLWRQSTQEFDGDHGSSSSPLSIFVTEGFGRKRMAQPVFQFLADQEDQMASILIPEGRDVLATRPSLFITSDRASGHDAIQRVGVQSGTIARLTDPEHLGLVVTCRSEPLWDPSRCGIARQVVDIEFSNGSRRFVPSVNLEVIQA